MKILDILKNIDVVETTGDMTTDITSVVSDSREVMPGSMFVALAGTKTDGHSFIPGTIKHGAKAIVCEVMPPDMEPSVTYISVKNSAQTIGQLLDNLYGNPASKLKIVGVTGTNGKTTTATLLYKMFTKLGHKSGLLSTVVNIVDDELVEATHTTPAPVQLYTLLKRMVDAGCEYCFMEVSSHSIHQHRISGLTFTGAIFSNLTHDHLDYHVTFDEYLRVKKSFFDMLPVTAFALTNADDKNGMVMLQNTRAQKYSYSCKSFSTFKCKVLEKHFDGMLLLIDETEVWVKFIGDFNAYNLLAVYSAARLLGAGKEETLAVLSTLTTVDGRFECYRSCNDVTVIVDYAHTPDALLNVLNTIEKLNIENKGSVITVVGAGGDRDKTKRPVMAKICAEMSTRVIITSDNPRGEDPAQIAADMKTGIPSSQAHKALTILDRAEAIKTAIFLARPGDIILVAGKGHETYQEVKGIKYHFDDREVVNSVFESLKIVQQ
jgi:UDP-N-acetylmuramoyl-L-alanyl-D-glutamate--2,6-diaminopimelate ligase